MISTIKRLNILFQDYQDFKEYIYRSYDIFLKRYSTKKPNYKKFVKLFMCKVKPKISEYKSEILYKQLYGANTSQLIPQLLLIRISLGSLTKQVDHFKRMCIYDSEIISDVGIHPEDKGKLVTDVGLNRELYIDNLVLKGIALSDAEFQAEVYLKQEAEKLDLLYNVIFPILSKMEILLYKVRRDFEAGYGRLISEYADEIAIGQTTATRLAYLCQLPEEQFFKIIEGVVEESPTQKSRIPLKKPKLTVAQTAFLFYYLRRKELISGTVNFSTLYAHVSQITGYSSNTLAQSKSKEEELLHSDKRGIGSYDHEKLLEYLDKVRAAIKEDIFKAG